jgi:starch-binding outer membrane protein SusE/F
MKNISKIIIAALVTVGFLAACSKIDNLTKVDELPLYKEGKSPILTSSTTTVAATLADTSNTVITFNWTNPGYANDSATTKYVLELDTTGGSFGNAASKTVSGALSTGLTGRELNAILLGYGYPVGITKQLDIRVLSSYANNNERYASNTIKVTVTTFADPSVLAGSTTEVSPTLATSGNKAIDFTWSRSFTGYPGVVTYAIEYDSAGKGFAAPIAISATPYTLTLTQGEINSAALAKGVAGGTTGKLDYRVKATTATGVVAYSNTFSVLINTFFPIRRYYMPGSYQADAGYGPDNWTPETAPELIRDIRTGALNDLYYTYIYFPAGTQFKLTEGRSWSVNYGGENGSLVQNGANFYIENAGVYRVVINATTKKYDIRQGRMGFVGGAVGNGWNPGGAFPNYELGLSQANLFVGLTDFSTGNEWKLIDSDNWNNGSLDIDNVRSYGSATANSGTMDINAGNFPAVSAAGRYRVIWDGRDRNNIKYEMSPATEMRVVGDGIQGVPAWSPGSSPQMTYQGAGIWTITVALLGGKDIKFLAGNDWGAFDYEDNGDAPGGGRKIKWEGGSNFKTPGADGTYTITLNENAQTVTIQ